MSSKPIYRVYFRYTDMSASDITKTDDANVAQFAMNLLERSSFGKDAEAVMTRDGKQIAYCNLQFD